MARMKIFNTLEEEAFESPPVFNSAERKRFFSLPLLLEDSMVNLRTPINKVCFLVVAGYFKARRKFFARQFHQTDIEYVARQIGVDPSEVFIKSYSKETYARHQRAILSYFGYCPFDEAAKTIITNEIAALIRVQFRPKLVLLEIIQVLTVKKIAIPSYNALADLIVAALNNHQRTLNKIIETCLTENQRTNLDTLLEKEPSNSTEEGWRYRLTLLKKPNQSTRPAKIRANLVDLDTVQTLYLDLMPVVQRLNLSYESIRYYAYSVIKAQIPQVSRRADEDRFLHLIAFIVYQTFKLNDLLIDTLLSAVQAAVNAAEKEQKEVYFRERDQRNQSFATLVEQFRQNVQATLSAIRTIVADAKLNDSQKVVLIDGVLNDKPTKPAQVEQQIDEFKQSAVKIQQGQDYFALLETRSLKLQHRVADIVRQVQFAPNCSKPALWTALCHYQQKDGNVDKSAPVDFLVEDQRVALTSTDGKFRVSLYKALFFVEVAEAIKSGALNLLHSEKFRSLDEYMIQKADWEVNRAEYLQRARLEGFADCKATLKALEKELDARYKETNQNLIDGKNPYLTIRPDGSFHVSTPKQEEVECLSLGTFFPERKYISMLEMLATVDHATNFLDEFEHWQIKYQRARPPKKILFAGIIGYGCDIGHRKLAQISKQIDDGELDNAVNWYFSLQNVQGANDRILRLTDRMNLPNIYRNQSDLLHTSSDGQKIDVAVDSLNANYSFKYLGKDKGASAVTFIDMRGLMWHSMVISSAEREAHYVIDGLMHNDVIKSDIHSTDTHGYSEVIFASTYLLGFEFAPRIKGVGRQQLYAFKHRKHYEEQGYLLLPDHYIRENQFEDQWDDVLRFIATIRLKIATASQLFKRLNSYSKQHPLYRALKEFGKIPKSLFILKYCDILEFRQAIEKQLNKVESSNKFSKAVSFGHSSEFMQSEKEDQEIAEACRRLIKNAAVCWNYLYLSQELATEKNEKRRAELIEAIRNGSVATWKHFNLHGEFDFSDERMVDSMGLAVPKNPDLKPD
ncbi:Tn3 family transposase [Methylomonas fluvii]|uniref:Tn3 family transposase n=1 Tax=Methylomonas fluvii TaxID=1854564 RepID=A0ABR9DLR9_9GAMM|nr:Tn3 family transposase [Methylomonas fluvii]MBD9363791.1 Tn3 family transposase [Methylomonas fluvii]